MKELSLNIKHFLITLAIFFKHEFSFLRLIFILSSSSIFSSLSWGIKIITSLYTKFKLKRNKIARNLCFLAFWAWKKSFSPWNVFTHVLLRNKNGVKCNSCPCEQRRQLWRKWRYRCAINLFSSSFVSFRQSSYPFRLLFENTPECSGPSVASAFAVMPFLYLQLCIKIGRWSYSRASDRNNTAVAYFSYNFKSSDLAEIGYKTTAPNKELGNATFLVGQS